MTSIELNIRMEIKRKLYWEYIDKNFKDTLVITGLLNLKKKKIL